MKKFSINTRTYARTTIDYLKPKRTDGGQAISFCTSPNLRNMEFKSLCIDLMPYRQIHGQADTQIRGQTDRHTDRQTNTWTDRQIHGQTGRHKVRNQEANRTYQVLIRIIGEKRFWKKEEKQNLIMKITINFYPISFCRKN